MEETKRRLGLPAALTIVAVVLVAAVFWAASALAAGGPGSSFSSGEQGSRDSPAAAATVQEGETPDKDCPNRGSESDASTDI